MLLSDLGEIARQCWDEIPGHFENVELDEFVMMPNHLHGVIHLRDISRRDEVTSSDQSGGSHIENEHPLNQFAPFLTKSKYIDVNCSKRR